MNTVSVRKQYEFIAHQAPLKKRDWCPKCKERIVDIRELAEHGLMCRFCAKKS